MSSLSSSAGGARRGARLPLIPAARIAAILLAIVPRPAASEQAGPPEEIAGTTVHIGRTPFSLQGFGDINFTAEPQEGRNSAFRDGALDLFATSQLDEDWSALVELLFESGGTDLVTSLERLQFTWQPSDAFKATVGRMHNPFLRWPVTFHHGLYVQTPLDRPILARGEDPGLWPIHFVGLLLGGRLDSPLGLSWSLGVGNGRGTILDHVQVATDANKGKALVGYLGVAPEAVPGLALGVAGYADRIPAKSGTLRERDWTLSASYVHAAIELRAEWSELGHKDLVTDIQHRSQGWYVLGAVKLPNRLSAVKPYLLIEELDVAAGEEYLGSSADQEGISLGVRWDVNRWVALKADWRSQRIGEAERDGIARAQLAVNF